MAEQLLKSKNVLLTGASRGIGSAIAEIYAKHGERIIFRCSGCAQFDTCHHVERILSYLVESDAGPRPFIHRCSVMQVLACT